MILVITHSADFYNVDLFFKYLDSLKIPFFRLNTDFLNHEQKISIFHDGTFTISDQQGNTVNGSAIKGVWHRKTWSITTPEILDESFIQVFKSEYSHLRKNLYQILSKIPWINPLEEELFIQKNKIYQLQVAESVGLNVPATLFSNDSNEIDLFLKSNKIRNAIAKLHGPTGQSMGGETMIETILINTEDENDFESMAYCPMIIQPYIEKEYELRIAYVDGKCFAGKINNSEEIDWRGMQGNLWEKYELPAEIREKLDILMKKFGLIVGAFDLIKGRDGNYWFLEVNPQGEWGMLQKELGYPIAETIAESLIKRI